MSALGVMSPPVPYKLREFHSFDASGSQFLYLVPSGAIFELNAIGQEVVKLLRERGYDKEELIQVLLDRGYDLRDIETSIVELHHADLLFTGEATPQLPR